jgi:hypothetical protein
VVEPSRFTDGGSVRWGALAGAVFGGAILAVWEGITRVILVWFDAQAEILAGIATFLASVVTVIVSGGGAVITGSFGEATEIVSGAGPLAFAGSVVVVLATVYVIALGVSRL